MLINPLCYCDGSECSYCFDERMQRMTQTKTPVKLEERRSSGFTITHEFKNKLEAVKYVSKETNIIENDVDHCLTLHGWFDHKFESKGIEVQYRLNP